MSALEQFEAVQTGDKVRFGPKNGTNRWWTVVDRDERYVIAIVQAPFEKRGTWLYTVVDLVGYRDHTYNGAGNGVVRSSLNTLGGGWDIDPCCNGAEKIIPALRSGEWELSHRRLANVWSVEHKVEVSA